MSNNLKSIKNTLSKFEVIPLPVPSVSEKNRLGYKMFPELYAAIFICAKKKSGKTNLINTILRACADKDTIVYIFSSTLEKNHS